MQASNSWAPCEHRHLCTSSSTMVAQFLMWASNSWGHHIWAPFFHLENLLYGLVAQLSCEWQLCAPPTALPWNKTRQIVKHQVWWAIWKHAFQSFGHDDAFPSMCWHAADMMIHLALLSWICCLVSAPLVYCPQSKSTGRIPQFPHCHVNSSSLIADSVHYHSLHSVLKQSYQSALAPPPPWSCPSSSSAHCARVLAPGAYQELGITCLDALAYACWLLQCNPVCTCFFAMQLCAYFFCLHCCTCCACFFACNWQKWNPHNPWSVSETAIQDLFQCFWHNAHVVYGWVLDVFLSKWRYWCAEKLVAIAGNGSDNRVGSRLYSCYCVDCSL